ncbi:MAG: hypothetical protein WBA39_33480 [Rivularia sp. (in: cyanobacteria)]
MSGSYNANVVKTIFQGNEPSNPSNFNVIGDEKLFFRASSGFPQDGLWVTDGTETGTEQIENVVTRNQQFGSIIPGKDKIFYQTSDRSGVFFTSVTDGTSEGTFGISNLFSFTPPNYLGVLNERLFLSINKRNSPSGTLIEGDSGLWVSDGTETGTSRVLTQEVMVLSPIDLQQSMTSYFS